MPMTIQQSELCRGWVRLVDVISRLLQLQIFPTRSRLGTTDNNTPGESLFQADAFFFHFIGEAVSPDRPSFVRSAAVLEKNR